MTGVPVGVGQNNLLSDHFASKQSNESVDLPFTSHLSSSLITLASRSIEVRRLLFDFHPYGVTDPLVMLPILRELL